ncbi:MAG TPA: amidase family protein [Gaiellales bacterium]|nr:amidase family protein [Gaiellales bacterium]
MIGYASRPAPPAEDEMDAASAGALAAAVGRREVTAVELAETAARRAQTRGAALNAVAVPLYAQAAAAAARIDARPAGRPLEGVPISLKETLWVRGTPCCAGVERLAGSRSRSDGAIARALRRAGAVILCKGNIAQLNWYAETDNPVYGRTDNPWAADRSPGGSSGGEAALVAAGVVPVAVGTDIGGSVRIPAAWCGVFGMAPTPGRLSLAGSRDDQLFAGQTLIQNRPGVLARDAADLRLVISVLDVGAGTAAPARPLRRVGVVRENGVLTPAPAIRRAVAETAERLAADGLEVVDVELADAPEALALFDAVFAADGGRGLRRMLRGGRATPQVSRALAAAADAALGPEELLRLEERIGALRRRFAAMLDREGLDALIGPAHARPAVPHGTARDVVAGQSYTSLYNLLGMPAGVAPVARVRPGEARDCGDDGSAGLPIGVQAAARPGDDEVVLTLLERISSH